MARRTHHFGETKSGLFLARDLDDPNHVEMAREIGFRAQRAFAGFRARAGQSACPLPDRQISCRDPVNRTNYQRSDRAGPLGNPLTIPVSMETLHLDPDIPTPGIRNCHFHKTICSTRGELDTAQATREEARPRHFQRSHRLVRQPENVVPLRARDRWSRTYRERSLATLRTESPPETRISARSRSCRRNRALYRPA
jgi:hypothetical protein